MASNFSLLVKQKMPNPKQNATSVPPASAGGNPQTLPASGPIAVSALADALVNSGAFADPNSTQVRPASPDAGAAAAPAGLEPLGEGQLPGTEEVPVREQPGEVEQTTTETPEGGEVEDLLPLLDEEQPGNGAPPEDNTEVGLKKRNKNLWAENQRLKEQLAQARNAPPPPGPAGQQPGGLERFTTVEALTAWEGQARRAVRELTTQLERINDDPESVESYLKGQNIKLQDRDGREDYSQRAMRTWLQDFRNGVQDQLEFAVPERKSVLSNQQNVHQNLVRVFPFLNDQTDQRYAYVQQLRSMPGVSQLPNPEWACLCFIEGERSLKAKLKARAAKLSPAAAALNGRRTAAAPNTGGALAPPLRNATAKRDQAMAEVRRTGSKQSLANLFELTGFARPPAA